MSTPVSLESKNNGSLDQGEQIRWQFDVPESGKLFILEVNQGNVIFYASAETTAPSEAFYQWKIELETNSSGSVYIRPEQRRRKKRSASVSETSIPVFTTLLGQAGRNTFTLTSGKPCWFKCHCSIMMAIYSQGLDGKKPAKYL